MNTDPNLTEGHNITVSVKLGERDHSSGTVTLQGHLYIPLSVVPVVAMVDHYLNLFEIRDDGYNALKRPFTIATKSVCF